MDTDRIWKHLWGSTRQPGPVGAGLASIVLVAAGFIVGQMTARFGGGRETVVEDQERLPEVDESETLALTDEDFPTVPLPTASELLQRINELEQRFQSRTTQQREWISSHQHRVDEERDQCLRELAAFDDAPTGVPVDQVVAFIRYIYSARRAEPGHVLTSAEMCEAVIATDERVHSARHIVQGDRPPMREVSMGRDSEAEVTTPRFFHKPRRKTSMTYFSGRRPRTARR